MRYLLDVLLLLLLVFEMSFPVPPFFHKLVGGSAHPDFRGPFSKPLLSQGPQRRCRPLLAMFGQPSICFS